MNVLLVSSKEDRSTYETVINKAPNANLLSTVTNVNSKFLEEIEERYHPHIVVWVSGVKISNNKTDTETVEAIKETYPYIRIIYFIGEQSYEKVSKALINTRIYDIIDRNITNLEFNELLGKPFKTREEADIFNKKRLHRIKPTNNRKKINISLLFPCVIFGILLILIIVLLIIKSATSLENIEENATESTVATEVQTDTATVATLYAVATQVPTEKTTEKETEKTTEEPTEKPTERKKSATESGENNNSNNGNSGNGSGGGVQQAEQPVQQVEQPVQQIEQPVQQQQELQTQITDDGQIHFDKDNYTVKAGEIFDIYVTGLAATNGCNWSLTNSAVAEFVSSDTTKVTVKAKAKGSTIITGTAKSNGATRQVLVTVE